MVRQRVKEREREEMRGRKTEKKERKSFSDTEVRLQKMIKGGALQLRRGALLA